MFAAPLFIRILFNQENHITSKIEVGLGIPRLISSEPVSTAKLLRLEFPNAPVGSDHERKRNGIPVLVCILRIAG